MNLEELQWNSLTQIGHRTVTAKLESLDVVENANDGGNLGEIVVGSWKHVARYSNKELDEIAKN